MTDVKRIDFFSFEKYSNEWARQTDDISSYFLQFVRYSSKQIIYEH